MSTSKWNDIISTIQFRSGKPIEQEIPDDMASAIKRITGTNVPEDSRRIITNLPNVDFEPGLSESEIKATEEKFNFRFPPDLREFLQTALPYGEGFPDWRSGNESVLRDWLNLPLEGILFDIQHNHFWLDEWGARPKKGSEAKRIASELIANAPKLIPIYIHRMIPDEPHLPGNPVFSVHQTDIIIYGFDLEDYLRSEFYLPGREPRPENIRSIRFWNIDRFQQVRWGDQNSAVTDPRTLPNETSIPASQNQQSKSSKKWWYFWHH